MFTAVSLQIAATACLGTIALLLYGQSAALSLIFGGAAALVPNALFAARLALHRQRPAESYPVVFFLGEFAKIGLTIALLAAVIQGYAQLQALPLMIGLIAALKAPLFALWITGAHEPVAQPGTVAQGSMLPVGKAH